MLPSVNSLSPQPQPSWLQGHSSNSRTRSEPPVEFRGSITTTTTKVEISGGSQSLLGNRAYGVEAYKEIESVDKVAKPAQAANPYAQAILSSIELQLQRDVSDGATTEELQSRLQAGLSGFEEGYSDAFNQLKDSGLLDDNVKSAIEETFKQVQTGILKMAENYGLEAPLTSTSPALEDNVVNPQAAPAPSTLSSITTRVTTIEERFTQSYRDLQTIKNLQKIGPAADTYEHLDKPKFGRVNTQYNYNVSESRDFSFKLRTQDGDMVTVKISNAQSGSSSLQMPSFAGGDAKVGVSGGQYSDYQLDIDGELDDAELDAISDLLAQVGDISEMFYRGDVSQAAALAASVEFDSEELSGFNLNLAMTSSEQVSETKRYARPEGAPRFSPSIEPFVQKFQGASDLAERLGQSKTMVPDLLRWMEDGHHRFHPHTDNREDSTNRTVV